MSDLDKDVEFMTRYQHKAEIRRLRAALRQLRDKTGHELCWYLPEVWDILPEKVQPHPEVPAWCDFMQQCAAFRRSLEHQHS
jgi:hypothetical protein